MAKEVCIIGIRGALFHGDVHVIALAFASPNFFDLTCPGKIRMTVKRNIKDMRVVVEDILDSVSMVKIPIQDQSFFLDREF